METRFDEALFKRTFGSVRRDGKNDTVSVSLDSTYTTRIVIVQIQLRDGLQVVMNLRSNEAVELGQAILKQGWASYALNDANCNEENPELYKDCYPSMDDVKTGRWLGAGVVDGA